MNINYANYLNYCIFVLRKQPIYNKKETSKIMSTTEKDPKKGDNSIVLFILVIRRFRTSKDAHENFRLLDISESNPAYLSGAVFIDDRCNYKESDVYRVETTQAEMKALYKEAGSINEDSPIIPPTDPRKFDNWRIVASSKRATQCQNGDFYCFITRPPFSIAKKTFDSPVGLDNGYTNEYLGDHKQTMELFEHHDKNYSIEWDIPSLDTTEHIGVFCHERDKVLSDYDGVFEMPEQARKLLEECGFDCSYLD